MDRLVGAGSGPVAHVGPQGRLAPADAPPAVAALAAGGPDPGIEGVEGGRVDLVEHGPAEVREDVAVDGAAVVGHGDGRDGPDLLAPLQPPLDQLANRSRASVAALAPVELLQQLGLDLLGLSPGGLGLPVDLTTQHRLRPVRGSRPAKTCTWRPLRRFLITPAPAAVVISLGLKNDAE